MSDAGTPERRGAWQALKVYGERRVLVMLLLGLAAGMPNLLIFDTLSAWLRDDGVSLAAIGFFSLATLAYTGKFLWAPLVDRTTIPGLTRLVGHRRSWMLVAQAAVIVGLFLISGSNPAANLGLVAVFAVLVGFAGATQDIVIDAWRIEAAEESKQGAMAAAYQWGYRIAALAAGMLALALADAWGWRLSYVVMSALMAIGVLGVLLAPREQQHVIRPIHTGDLPARPGPELIEWLGRALVFLVGILIAGAGLTGNPFTLTLLSRPFGAPEAFGLAEAWTAQPWAAWLQVGAVGLGLVILALACCPLPGVRTRPGAFLGESFGAPLGDFFRRYRGVASLILALICLYRLADFVLNIVTPFYIDLGFTLTEIGEVRKFFGMFMTMAGVFLGGYAVARLGVLRALMIGAFAGPLSNLAFAWLALQGAEIWALMVTIGIDNVAGGFAATCLIAYMSSLTSSGFTAAQYALFSSLYALPGKLIASQSGRLVEASARAAEAGGPLAWLQGGFGGRADIGFVEAMAKSGVTPAALGSGYIAFFLYSTALGALGIVLTWVVMRRQPAAEAAAKAAAAEATAAPKTT